MTLKLHLGVRTNPGSYRRVTLNDVNSATKIIDLKVEAGKATNLPMESLGEESSASFLFNPQLQMILYLILVNFSP